MKTYITKFITSFVSNIFISYQIANIENIKLLKQISYYLFMIILPIGTDYTINITVLDSHWFMSHSNT